ncbi:hypothetical protein OUZ56_024056 [Daphnia magna]|uniref:Uncharacterized protein n=1 Tax=Daphnia magna TaxID=35525 RepID=A0ABR0B019_9CRUS|nr:hypothetical protein OUZ56_024056 [Daphnia magna]
MLSSPFFSPRARSTLQWLSLESVPPLQRLSLERVSPLYRCPCQCSGGVHETKITFELYGADPLPKPARRMVERVKGLHELMGEGSVKGGLPGPSHNPHVFPLTFMSTGGLIISNSGFNSGAGESNGP